MKMNSEIKNIVIIQTAFIGDTALALFFARSVKQAYPNSRIIFVCTPVAKDLIANCEIIDRCIPFDKRKEYRGLSKIKLFAEIINKEKPDIVFSLHRSFRTSLLVKNIKAELKVGFANSAISHVYKVKAKYISHLHEVYRNNQLLVEMGFSDKVDLSPIAFNTKIDNLNAYSDKKRIYISPGSVWKTKQWLPEYYHDLVAMLSEKFSVIIGGSKKEYSLCEKVIHNTSATNTSCRYRLDETVELIRTCDLVICNDSAATHLSALAGTKCITIFGATDPIFGFASILQDSVSLKDESLKCSPCAIHGETKCPLGTIQCMKNVSPKQVFDVAFTMLK